MQLRRASRVIMEEISALREETLKELGLPSQKQEAAEKPRKAELTGSLPEEDAK